MITRFSLLHVLRVVLAAGAWVGAAPSAPAQTAAPAAAGTQEFLDVYFEEGSASLRPQDARIIDQAARTYREGQPIVMILTGSTDTVGSPIQNLSLSQRRAQAVLDALVARGIPAARFQILAKGATEPAVPDPPNTPEAQNRRVEIAWR